MNQSILRLIDKLILLAILLCPQAASAEASYWGGSGLLQIPNGRVIEDGDLRFTFSHTYPYRTYAGTFGFYPFLELNGRVVELRHTPKPEEKSKAWKGYGYNKTRAADAKIQLIREDEWWPSIALGAQDIHGTKQFSSKYLTASRKCGPLDFTLGYGKDRLKGLFGGMEWEMNPRLSFLAEYDPAETLAPTTQPIGSHCNWGLRWKPWKWLNLDFSFQRGEEAGFLLSMTYPLGEPAIPQKPDYPFVGPIDYTPLVVSGIESRLTAIQDYLVKEGFYGVKVTLSSNLSELYVEYENGRYLSQTKALGRVLRVVCTQAPTYVECVHIIIKCADIPLVQVCLDPKDFINLVNGKISTPEMLEHTVITTAIPRYGAPDWEEDITVGEEELLGFAYGFRPVGLETYLNDPSGFFKFRAGPTIWMEKQLAPGLAALVDVRLPLYSDVGTTMPPITDKPIRSDIVNYLENTGICIENAVLDYVFRLDDNSFGRLSAGYMELQFAGASSEYLRLFRGGRFALGSEITWARKRSPDSLLGLEDFETISPRLKGYLFIPELHSTLEVQAGRFLAGDKGVRFELTRYIRGGSVFLWYSKTDTSDFSGPNRGYSDKGVGITIPLSIFSDHERRGVFDYGLSQWSRDVGQVVEEPNSLYQFIREFTPSQIISEWEKITD